MPVFVDRREIDINVTDPFSIFSSLVRNTYLSSTRNEHQAFKRVQTFSTRRRNSTLSASILSIDNVTGYPWCFSAFPHSGSGTAFSAGCHRTHQECHSGKPGVMVRLTAGSGSSQWRHEAPEGTRESSPCAEILLRQSGMPPAGERSPMANCLPAAPFVRIDSNTLQNLIVPRDKRVVVNRTSSSLVKKDVVQ